MVMMFSEISASVWTAIITSLAALGVAIGNAVATKRMNAAQAAKAHAEADKIKAEAAKLANDEWRGLFDKMKQRCDDYDKKIDELESKINVQNEYISYLFNGITVLVEQIEGMGEEPHFHPKPKFRGTNGAEYDFGD